MKTKPPLHLHKIYRLTGLSIAILICSIHTLQAQPPLTPEILQPIDSIEIQPFNLDHWLQTIRVEPIHFHQNQETETDTTAQNSIKSFERNKTQFIHWDVVLASDPPTEPVNFDLIAELSTNDGRIVMKDTMMARFSPGQSTASFSEKYGNKYIGSIPGGTYHLEIKTGDLVIHKDQFEIVDPGVVMEKEEWLEGLTSHGIQLFMFNQEKGEKNQKIYTELYNRYILRNVLFEIELGSPPPNQNIEFYITFMVFDSEKNRVKKAHFKTNFPASETNLFYTNEYEIGKASDFWKVGEYTLVVYIDDKMMGMKEFEIR